MPLCGPLRPLKYGADVGFDDFDAVISDWIEAADQDGAFSANERHKQDREVATREQPDKSWKLTGTFAATQGAAIKEALDRFEDLEFDKDRAEAKERLGDDVKDRDLARTAKQRSADALESLCEYAVATKPRDRLPEPLLSIAMDEESFEEGVERFLGEDSASFQAPTLEQVMARYCRTTSGYSIPVVDAIAKGLIGHVRRVVTNKQGRVIDLGRSSRCFTGAAREAVTIPHVRCRWPGCDIPVRRCQIDHQHKWTHGGRTDAENGEPHCGHHNRLREAGFRAERQPNGTLNHYRPDGTQI